MKVTLAIASWDLWEDGDYSVYPLGLAYLASVLEKNGHDVKLLNLSLSRWEDIKDNVIETIKQEQPEVLGISILTNSRTSARKFIEIVKEYSPKTLIVAGGIHTTYLYEQILDNFKVDFAVLGEAEGTFVELLDAYQQKKPIEEFKKIDGMAFKHKGELIKTGTRKRIDDLDSIPFPKHELFRDQIEKSGFAYMMTSRGCPFSCDFCPSTAFWGFKLKQRSIENIIEEIKYLVKEFPSMHTLQFSDDEFICNNKRVLELCKRMIEEKFNLNWVCLGRASSVLDEEVILMMKKAGCSAIFFGIESGSQRILDGISKRIKIQQVVDSFTLCKKHGIEPRFLSIVGLPGENAESVNETIKLAKKLRVNTEPAILIVYPGTAIYEEAKKRGLLTDDYWLEDGLCPLFTCEHPKWRLWWWSFKTGLITYYYDEDHSAYNYFHDRIIKKMIPANFKRIVKRYVTDRV